MRNLLLIAAVSAGVACSTSPTAPSPVGPEPRPLANLRWDVAAPGCPSQAPPSPLPNPADASLEPGPHGAILARFPYRLDTGRGVMLHARLVERGSELLVCEWDIVDL